MRKKPPQVDEDLHSRQLAVYGREAMAKFANSNVLVIGLKGLGAEVAKNVILAGVRSVTLIDPTPADVTDLSAQFYLSPSDVGQARAAACLKRLQGLNPAVKVEVEQPPAAIDAAFVRRFQCIVATEMPLAQASAFLGSYCLRQAGTRSFTLIRPLYRP